MWSRKQQNYGGSQRGRNVVAFIIWLLGIISIYVNQQAGMGNCILVLRRSGGIESIYVKLLINIKYQLKNKETELTAHWEGR